MLGIIPQLQNKPRKTNKGRFIKYLFFQLLCIIKLIQEIKGSSKSYQQKESADLPLGTQLVNLYWNTYQDQQGLQLIEVVYLTETSTTLNIHRHLKVSDAYPPQNMDARGASIAEISKNGQIMKKELFKINDGGYNGYFVGFPNRMIHFYHKPVAPEEYFRDTITLTSIVGPSTPPLLKHIESNHNFLYSIYENSDYLQYCLIRVIGVQITLPDCKQVQIQLIASNILSMSSLTILKSESSEKQVALFIQTANNQKLCIFSFKVNPANIPGPHLVSLEECFYKEFPLDNKHQVHSHKNDYGSYLRIVDKTTNIVYIWRYSATGSLPTSVFPNTAPYHFHYDVGHDFADISFIGKSVDLSLTIPEDSKIKYFRGTIKKQHPFTSNIDDPTFQYKMVRVNPMDSDMIAVTFATLDEPEQLKIRILLNSVSCSPECVECLGSEVTDCLRCAKPNFVNLSSLDDIDGYCSSFATQEGEYLSFYDLRELSDVKKNCPTGCQTCTNGWTCDQCTNPDEYYDQYARECVSSSSCTPKFTIPNSGTNQCDKCKAPCIECSGTTSSCSKCKSPTQYPNQYGVCQDCSSPCVNCSGGGETECLSCISKAIFLKNSNSVKQGACTCQPGTVLQNSKCEECDSSCATCSDSPAHCQTCHSNAILNKNTNPWTCIQPCGNNCNQCANDKCIECQSGYEIDLNKPDECIQLPIRSLKVLEKFFLKKTTSAHFIFDKPLIKKDFNNVLVVSLVTGKTNRILEESLEFDIKLNKATDGLIVKLTLKDSIEDGVLLITNTASRNIEARPTSDGSDRRILVNARIESFTDEKLEIESISYYNSESISAAIQSVKTASVSSLKVASAATVAIALPFGILLIRLVQMFDFLRYININLPVNFIKFLEIFESNIFDLIPNFFRMKEDGYCQLHPKLVENEMDCFIINSAGNILFQILGYIIIKGILKLILSCNSSKKSTDIQKKPSLFTKWIKKVDDFMNIAFFSELMIAMHMDLQMSVFSNLRSFMVKPFSVFLNSLISLGVLAFYLRMIYVVVWKSIKLEIFKSKHGSYEGEMLEEELKEWGFLKEELKPKVQGSGRFIGQIHFARDFFLTFFIISFLDSPVVQILPVLVIFGVTLYVVMKYKPFQKSSLNLLTLINEVVYFILLLLFFTLHLMENNITEKQRYQYFGYSMILLVGFSIVMNLGICLWMGIQMLIEKCKKKKDDGVSAIKNKGSADLNESGMALRGDKKNRQLKKRRKKSTNKVSIDQKPERSRKRSERIKIRQPSIKKRASHFSSEPLNLEERKKQMD